RDIALVELDQSRFDVVAAGMLREGPDEVPALAGAHADDPDRSAGRGVHGVTDLALDDVQAVGQRRLGIVVASVPLPPVAGARQVTTPVTVRPCPPGSGGSRGRGRGARAGRGGRRSGRWRLRGGG